MKVRNERRTTQIKINEKRKDDAAVKNELDRANLDLQALHYEDAHYTAKIQACKQFQTPSLHKLLS